MCRFPGDCSKTQRDLPLTPGCPGLPGRGISTRGPRGQRVNSEQSEAGWDARGSLPLSPQRLGSAQGDLCACPIRERSGISAPSCQGITKKRGCSTFSFRGLCPSISFIQGDDQGISPCFSSQRNPGVGGLCPPHPGRCLRVPPSPWPRRNSSVGKVSVPLLLGDDRGVSILPGQPGCGAVSVPLTPGQPRTPTQGGRGISSACSARRGRWGPARSRRNRRGQTGRDPGTGGARTGPGLHLHAG